MRKRNDEIYQLAKDQALVKKLKNKRLRPFCWCSPDVMFVTRGSQNSLFFSLILFPTWFVVNDINFGSTKVIQWVPRWHSVDSRARENFRHRPSSLERNWKKWHVGQVVAFRWPKSIKDTLVRAAVSRPSSTVGQCKPCGDKRCKCCLQLQHAQAFHSKTTGKEYKIFCNVNCKTPNVVYLLDCHVCGSQYVGESVQPFNKRMNGHRSDLTKKML